MYTFEIYELILKRDINSALLHLLSKFWTAIVEKIC